MKNPQDMLVITIIAIVFVLILSVVFFAYGSEMIEYKNGFLYFAGGMLLLIIGLAVFMTFAVPSVAKFNKGSQTAVTQEESNLLEE